MVTPKYSLFNVFVLAGALLAWNDLCSYLKIDLLIDRTGFIVILGFALLVSLNHPLKFRKYLGNLEYVVYVLALVEILKFLGFKLV